MWIDPKTNWTRDSVPLPEDFNRIEGNVRELKAGVDGLAGSAKITNIAGVPNSITLGPAANKVIALLPSQEHHFYLISVYSPTVIVSETMEVLTGYITWSSVRGKAGEKDAILIYNRSDYETATVYIKAAYIS